MSLDLPPDLRKWQLPKSAVQGPDKRVVTWWDQQQAKNRAALTRVFSIFMGIVYLWLGISNIHLLRITNSGSPASWTSQLSVAQQEAAKIDKDAVLYSLTAELHKYKPSRIDGNNTLDVDFIFLRPSGGEIRVTMLDIDPPLVTKVDPKYSMGGAPSHEELQGLREKLSTIKVGPRDLLKKTLAEGLAFAKPQDTVHNVHANIYLDIDWQKKLGVPVAWHINYTIQSKQLTLFVSPLTGDILERHVRELGVKPSVTPATP